MRFELMPKLAVGQQHAGQEGTKAHAQAHRFHQPGGTGHYGQAGRSENFHHPCPRDDAEQVTQSEAAAHHHQRDHQHGVADG